MDVFDGAKGVAIARYAESDVIKDLGINNIQVL